MNVFIPTHEEILKLKSVVARNKRKPNSVKLVTKDRAYSNGTRAIDIQSICLTCWTIYPFKGSIRDAKYMRKKGLSFETVEDWEFALNWIIDKVEEIEAMYS
jgi:maleate cis-trans isomerase